MTSKATDAIFAQLRLGVAFDSKRWKKQIDLFENQPGADGPAAAAAVAAQQQGAAPPQQQQQQHDVAAPGESRKKKKQRMAAEAAAAEAEQEADAGILLFGGQAPGAEGDPQGGGQPAEPPSPGAAFVDSDPHVHTGDPFEEANVLRKAHRIKVSGSAPPPPLRSFADLDGRPGCCKRLLRCGRAALPTCRVHWLDGTALCGLRSLAVSQRSSAQPTLPPPCHAATCWRAGSRSPPPSSGRR